MAKHFAVDFQPKRVGAEMMGPEVFVALIPALSHLLIAFLELTS